MRLTVRWRGKPLLVLDFVATSPADAPDPSLDPPMGLSGAPGGLQDRAEEATTRLVGFAVPDPDKEMS